jgi:uncharacterized HAD superfamily protein
MDFIFDIDSTLSDDNHRSHYLMQTPKDWDNYYSNLIHDSAIEPSVRALQALYNDGHKIILCTGRPEQYRELTMQWLEKHNILIHDLFMRLPEDGRVRNAEAKRIMIERIKLAGYNPIAVYEDNPYSVEMWKSLGLVVYHVK